MQNRKNDLALSMESTDQQKKPRTSASATDDERGNFEDLPDEVRALIFSHTTNAQQFFSLAHTNKRNINVARDKTLAAHKEGLEKEAEVPLAIKIQKLFDQCEQSLILAYTLKYATIPCTAWDPAQDDMLSPTANMALTLFVTPIVFATGRTAAAYESITTYNTRKNASKALVDDCDNLIKNLNVYCDRNNMSHEQAAKALKLNNSYIQKFYGIHLNGAKPTIEKMTSYSM